VARRRRTGQERVIAVSATPKANTMKIVTPAIAKEVSCTAVARKVPARPMKTAGPE
jgi:hypothetical protein